MLFACLLLKKGCTSLIDLENRNNAQIVFHVILQFSFFSVNVIVSACEKSLARSPLRPKTGFNYFPCTNPVS